MIGGGASGRSSSQVRGTPLPMLLSLSGSCDILAVGEKGADDPGARYFFCPGSND